MLKDFNKYNPSTWFIYPIFNLPRECDNFLFNTYLYHEDFQDLVEHIYFVYKFSGRISEGNNLYSNKIESNYLELETLLQQHPNYFLNTDINSGEYVMFVFEIPEDYILDYNNFLVGNYSLLRKNKNEYKFNSPPIYDMINQRWNNKDLRGIINKTEEWRTIYNNYLHIKIPKEQEYFVSPKDINVMEKEYFKENKLPIKILI